MRYIKKQLLFFMCLFLLLTLVASCAKKAPEKENSNDNSDTSASNREISQPDEQEIIYYIDPKAANFTYADYTTFSAMQGIVNRQEPKLFLKRTMPYYSDSEKVWMDYYSQAKNYKFQKLFSLEQAINIFKDYFTGIIEFDETLKSHNGWVEPEADCAAVIASLTNTLPVSNVKSERISATCDLPILKEVTVEGNGKNGVIDCDFSKYDFKTSTDAYRWQFENLREYTNSQAYMALTSESMDYAVNKKMMFFDLRPTKSEADSELLDEINDFFDSNNDLFYVWGWVDIENVGVHALSLKGGVLKCTGSPNLSFHASVPSDIKEFKQKTNVDIKNTAYDPNKFYVAFMASESDTTKAVSTLQHGAWMDENRGKAPISWGLIADTVIDFPALAEYYYENATENDYFYSGGQSLAGFVDFGAMPEDSKSALIKLTKELSQKSDQYLVDTYNDWAAFSKILDNREAYESMVKEGGLYGITGHYTLAGGSYTDTSLEKWNDVLMIRQPYRYPRRSGVDLVADEYKTVLGGFENDEGSMVFAGSENYILFGRKENDYLYLKADILPDVQNDGEIALRAFVSEDGNNFYEARITKDSVKLILSLDGEETVLAQSSQKLIGGEVAEVRLICDGSRIKLYFNGTTVADVDNDMLTSGYAGVYCNGFFGKLDDASLALTPQWLQIAQKIEEETIGSGKDGGISIGYYGSMFTSDFSKNMYRIEPGPNSDEVIALCPTDIMNICDYLSEKYPGRFVFTTLDELYGAALSSIEK